MAALIRNDGDGGSNARMMKSAYVWARASTVLCVATGRLQQNWGENTQHRSSAAHRYMRVSTL